MKERKGRWDKCKCGKRMLWDSNERIVTCPSCKTMYSVEADDHIVYWLEEKIPEPTRWVTRAK